MKRRLPNSLSNNRTTVQMVVLDTKEAKTATPDILATHCIPSAISEDLRT